MTRALRLTVAAGAVVASSVANLALACPSCASPLEENRQAFVDTTIFLSLAPLLMIGGLIWWIRRKAKQMEDAPEIQVHEALLRDAGRFTKGQ